MASRPRLPRSIKRSSDYPDAKIASPPLVRRVDPRQADLFAPKFIKPCKPMLARRVPVGRVWQYEIKHDGYRAQVHLFEGQVRVFTKSGHDWTERMPGIVAALEQLEVASAVIDGEAVMEDAAGATDFFALHAALARKSAPGAILYAFDLLELNGTDLRTRPLAERRATLAEILISAPAGVELSTHLDGDGEVMLEHACEMGLEGIVAKRKDAPYRSGESDAWRKIKCTQTESFAVIGCEPVGRADLRALRLARLKSGELVPCGWVGSGLDRKAARVIRAALDDGMPVVVDVEHRGWTPGGELRHPVFKGWQSE
jgi:bifunctional non-homologous end joining protein LigD